MVGYNEFCAPSLEETFEEAAKQEAERVIVITNMLTQGVDHAEIDIPAAIQQARQKFPRISFFQSVAFVEKLKNRMKIVCNNPSLSVDISPAASSEIV